MTGWRENWFGVALFVVVIVGLHVWLCWAIAQ